MTLIREAAERDNDALNKLQKLCPMGTSLVLGVDSSPDYFARSRPFKDWHVFVAAENNTIIGSAAFAIRDTYVEGRKIKTAYEYGFVVDPLHRRKGIAEKLQKHIEHIALDNDVDLLHLGHNRGQHSLDKLVLQNGIRESERLHDDFFDAIQEAENCCRRKHKEHGRS